MAKGSHSLAFVASQDRTVVGENGGPHQGRSVVPLSAITGSCFPYLKRDA